MTEAWSNPSTPSADEIEAGTLATLASRPLLRGEWVSVAEQSAGSRVYRVAGRHTYYVKTSPPTDAEDLRFHAPSEAERLTWVRAQGLPAPEVVDVGEDRALSWLITAEQPGRPASAGWGPSERSRVLAAVADFVRTLHALPVETCPFDRRLAVTLRWAESAVRTERVDLDDIEPIHRGWTAGALLAALEAQPSPSEDPVVCHGDLCLDNLLVDPHSLSVSGVLDVGRLGVADRWRDLAVVLRNLEDGSTSWETDAAHATTFLGRYGHPFDEPKNTYYRLLDEFF